MKKRKITLGTTYYNNPEAIQIFIDNHAEHADELIIVDDGSPDFPLTDTITPTEKIKIFRVKKDYGFNSHGCRNLIMTVASNDWVVLMDSDRLFYNPEYSFNFFRKTPLLTHRRYTFVCHAGYVGNQIHESVNDFLICKQHFFSVGGYDEEFMGSRCGDREFFIQLKTIGIDKNIPSIDVLLTRPSTLSMSSGHNTISPNDVKLYMNDDMSTVVNERLYVPQPNKPILTFDWEQIETI
jgi:glycosyltransferase involved in cell wall biosynthesis|tara:strand:+ start:663 stop:1376 length:714 start_codon:yes stop_codon:yes gene_type:complete